MKPARAPRDDKMETRLLVVIGDRFEDSSIECLAKHLRAGDLLVVNDAATLPASLNGRDGDGNLLEVRLTAQLNDRVWRAVVFGSGDWRTPTENRPGPPTLRRGDKVFFSEDFFAGVLSESGL